MTGLLRRRVLNPLIALLKQGITPEKIALSVAFGIVLGIFPVLGSTTLLCAAAALLLRLNLPAIQLVNFLIYPLQLALVVPFIRAGDLLLRAPVAQVSLAQMKALLHSGFLDAIHQLWLAVTHAILAWAVIAPVAVFAFYHLSLFGLRRARFLAPADSAIPGADPGA